MQVKQCFNSALEECVCVWGGGQYSIVLFDIVNIKISHILGDTEAAVHGRVPATDDK